MKRFIAVVAVIGLTLTVITGCATRNESVEALAIEAEASASASLAQDCEAVKQEWDNSMYESKMDFPKGMTNLEKFDERLIMFLARTWPQMNDPDLKELFRAMANAQKPGEEMEFAGANYYAFKIICPSPSF